VPYGVTDTWGTYSIVDTLYVHLWPSYPLYVTSFQTSRGKGLEKAYSYTLGVTERIDVILLPFIAVELPDIAV
jgi:hypothetical protein